MRNITLLILTSLASLVFSPLAALAQSDTVVNEDEIPAASFASDLSPKGLVSCFDYYQFGSVQADIDTNVMNAVSGTPITFIGELVNNNPYPVVDGVVYAKVFRLRDSVEKNSNGPHVVDQFIVRDGVALSSGARMPIQFSWDIPSYAISGEYRIAMFFITSGKFNLLGLSFTDDVVGNIATFSVRGEREDGVFFDKDSVTVNEVQHHFAAYPLRIGETEPAEIVAVVRNDTDTDANVPITWTLYAWDAQQQENYITEQKSTTFVPAHSSTNVSFTAGDTTYPVYLVEGRMQWHDSNSIINVRFVRESVNRLRINFPSIDKFPIEKDESTTVFSCLHNSGSADVVEDGRLELQLIDDRGRVVHEYAYAGAVTGSMMGVADEFVSDRRYDNFKLVAKLYQNEQLVDESSVIYDCNKINPDQCAQEWESGPFLDRAMLIKIITGGAMLIIAILILLMIVRRKRRSEKRTAEMKPHASTGTSAEPGDTHKAPQP